MLKTIPYSLNIPVNISGLKLSFYITEILRSNGLECVSPPHTHGDFEFKYLTSGNSTQVIEDDEIRTKSGDIIILHPGESHYQTEDVVSPNLVQYSIRFGIKNRECSASERLVEILSDIRVLHDDRFTLAPLFNKLTNEISKRKDGYFNYLQAVCTEIFIELMRLSGANLDEIFSTDDSKFTSYWRDRMDQYMHKNFQHDIKLEDLSAEISLSPRHASRMVMKEYGMTFVQKLTEIRLDNAKHQLKSTKRDIETISSSCGFQSYSYFTTCFKKNLGMTPGQYRSKFNKLKK